MVEQISKIARTSLKLLPALSVVLYRGDCTIAMSRLPDNSVDSIVCDPPYGLRFMQKKTDGWDDLGKGSQQREWHKRWLNEAFRVLKPGGHLAAFGGTRTYHHLASAVEEVGFDLRDSLVWGYSSGFPKSHNVSKSMDKEAGKRGHESKAFTYAGLHSQDGLESWGHAKGYVPPELITEEAKEWEGWGTALKPAFEPIVLARKPIEKKLTVAKNVLKHRTGAINVDACRVGLTGGTRKTNLPENRNGHQWMGIQGGAPTPIKKGRWPPNVLFTHNLTCNIDGCTAGCMVAALNKQSGTIKSSKTVNKKKGNGYHANFGAMPKAEAYGDVGAASKFFPVSEWDTRIEVPFIYKSKAAKKEKEAGCESLKLDADGKEHARGNRHVTVKPVAVMRWLVRLLTPPGGTTLDPFMGSGTAAIAAMQEGFNYIGMEIDPYHCEISKARISHVARSLKEKGLHTVIAEPVNKRVGTPRKRKPKSERNGGWEFCKGPKIQADLSLKGDYVIAHFSHDYFDVSYRPTGEHHAVGNFKTLKAAKKAADKHKPGDTKNTAWGALEKPEKAPSNAVKSKPTTIHDTLPARVWMDRIDGPRGWGHGFELVQAFAGQKYNLKATDGDPGYHAMCVIEKLLADGRIVQGSKPTPTREQRSFGVGGTFNVGGQGAPAVCWEYTRGYGTPKQKKIKAPVKEEPEYKEPLFVDEHKGINYRCIESMTVLSTGWTTYLNRPSHRSTVHIWKVELCEWSDDRNNPKLMVVRATAPTADKTGAENGSFYSKVETHSKAKARDDAQRMIESLSGRRYKSEWVVKTPSGYLDMDGCWRANAEKHFLNVPRKRRSKKGAPAVSPKAKKAPSNVVNQPRRRKPKAERGAKLKAPLLLPGAPVYTVTGRSTSLVPNGPSTSSDRAIAAALKRVDSWLRKEAIAESVSRNDDFNRDQFRRINPKRMTVAEREGINMYLFKKPTT